MKKIIAAALSAAMMFTGVTALADSDILVDYNGEYMECETSPKNVDGRVMLPFRDVLESMGASVGYDDVSKLVTAAKDGITITFTLLDDTIYIDDNGAKSQITMDVPMIVEDGHTLVPVRFLSEALGMKVGWENNTVFILDTAALADELAEKAPNLSKLIELGNPDVNSSKSDIKLGLDISPDAGGGTASSFDLDMTADTTVGEKAVGMKAIGSMNISADKTKIAVSNSSFETVIADGAVYIKTDAFKKAKLTPPSAEFSAITAFLPANQWYKLDIKELLAKSGMPEKLREQLADILSNPAGYKPDLEQILSTAIPDGEPQLLHVTTAKMLISSYAAIDKCISVTETQNGGYTETVKMTTDDIISMMADIMATGITDFDNSLKDNLRELKDILDINIDVTSSYDGKTAKSEGEISITAKADGKTVSMDMELSETAQKLGKITEPSVPDDAVDLMALISNI